jgi:hypothetical protein
MDALRTIDSARLTIRLLEIPHAGVTDIKEFNDGTR